MVIVDTRVRIVRLIVDNDESDAVTADLTVSLSSRSSVVLVCIRLLNAKRILKSSYRDAVSVIQILCVWIFVFVVCEEHGIALSAISRLWQGFQDDGNVSKCYNKGRPRVTTPNEDRYIWQLLPKETDGAQHHTCLVRSLQLLVRQFQGRTCTDARFSLQSDSRRTLIWRAPGTHYHQENTIERNHYGGAGWLFWGGIILVVPELTCMLRV
ncbi:HTH_Tnp_Tc3_2 domain-containing protein [Trichonephila clavipes]|nr:HTH_Tnp_Tc3_2 domain-containing protein [Trichonephila clavipes]